MTAGDRVRDIGTARFERTLMDHPTSAIIRAAMALVPDIHGEEMKDG